MLHTLKMQFASWDTFFWRWHNCTGYQCTNSFLAFMFWGRGVKQKISATIHYQPFSSTFVILNLKQIPKVMSQSSGISFFRNQKCHSYRGNHYLYLSLIFSAYACAVLGWYPTVITANIISAMFHAVLLMISYTLVYYDLTDSSHNLP